MINTVDTPNIVYPVIILGIEPNILKTDGTDSILGEKEEENQWPNSKEL